MSRIIFHSHSNLGGNLDSGSKVRPEKIRKAFEELGYKVDTISGSANQRKQDLRRLKDQGSDYEFCYSEPSTWPGNPFVDYPIYKYLYTSDIPIGIFYRDIYWKFSDMFDQTGLKKWELKIRYHLDAKVFDAVADIIYCPTESFEHYLNFNTPINPLPPAGEDKIVENQNGDQPSRAIYVGGVSLSYGPDILANAFKKVNENTHFELDLVCRKAEFKKLPDNIRSKFEADWATIHHVSGEALEDVYNKADVGIGPHKITPYNNIAMGVKIFEYLSHGLPIVMTNCDEMGGFVRKNECGIVCDDSAEAMADALLRLKEQDGVFLSARESAVATLDGNRWVDRAQMVASQLTR